MAIAARMRRRNLSVGPATIPAWLVTFADLMCILVSFFVLIISFSIQDQYRLQVVAGSMRDAFGVKPVTRRAGMIEVSGSPLREHVKDVVQIPIEFNSEFATERHDENQKQGPEANTHEFEKSDIGRPRQFATATVSLRQAFQEMPEIAEISNNIVMEETEDGLNLQIVDEDGRSMFAPGSKMPYERTRKLLEHIAPALARLPNRVMITGHTTAASAQEGLAQSPWDLSGDRADAARDILETHGLAPERIFSVVGKADTEPLYLNDPFLASNRRISILLMKEEPPVPSNLQP